MSNNRHRYYLDLYRCPKTGTTSLSIVDPDREHLDDYELSMGWSGHSDRQFTIDAAIEQLMKKVGHPK